MNVSQIHDLSHALRWVILPGLSLLFQECPWPWAVPPHVQYNWFEITRNFLLFFSVGYWDYHVCPMYVIWVKWLTMSFLTNYTKIPSEDGHMRGKLICTGLGINKVTVLPNLAFISCQHPPGCHLHKSGSEGVKEGLLIIGKSLLNICSCRIQNKLCIDSEKATPISCINVVLIVKHKVGKVVGESYQIC